MLPNYVARVLLSLSRDAGEVLQKAVSDGISEGKWDSYLNLEVDPRRYSGAWHYFKDAACAAYLKKLPDLPTSVSRSDSAYKKWEEGEQSCFISNRRLDKFIGRSEGFSLSASDERIYEFFMDTRKIIKSWIGARPPDLTIGRFGPGATFLDRGGRSTVPHKISSVPTITRDAIWYLPQWLGTQWGASSALRHGQLNFVSGNRHSLVPKTAKIDRSIAVEPSINVFYQLGLGRVLRNRLRVNAGWDLDSAQSVHRKVALESSKSLEFATLDLSNASDTVSTSLVKLVLPPLWFEALDDLRSKKTSFKGSWRVLEKFSSMGNGFTFELETIIFAALCLSALRHCGREAALGVDLFVFGDDIIVPDSYVQPIVSVLRFCGLSLNDQKSFWGSVPFRESCGLDAFNGFDVRPFCLKKLPSNPLEHISHANGLRRLYLKMESPFHRHAWARSILSVPLPFRRLIGPEYLGDVVLHGPEELWTTKVVDGIRMIKGLNAVPRSVVRYRDFDPSVVLACATYGCGGSERGGVIPRDGLLNYKVGWIPVS